MTSSNCFGPKSNKILIGEYPFYPVLRVIKVALNTGDVYILTGE